MSFWIARDGSPDEAKHYFTLAVENGGVGSIDYVLAKAYLTRLKSDRDPLGAVLSPNEK